MCQVSLSRQDKHMVGNVRESPSSLLPLLLACSSSKPLLSLHICIVEAGALDHSGPAASTSSYSTNQDSSYDG